MSNATRYLDRSQGEHRERSVSSHVRDLMDDPRLDPYSLSERRAILCHHLYLNFAAETEVGLSETLESWEGEACKPWRHQKMALDRREQLRRIRRYRRWLVVCGKAVTLEVAATLWSAKHAARWREWWETQPDSTPLFFPYFFFNFFAGERGPTPQSLVS